MFHHNLPFKKISLLTTASIGLLVSLATISLAGGPPPQGKPVSQPQGKPVSQPQGKPVSQPATTPPANGKPVSAPTPVAPTPTTPKDAPPRFPLPGARVTPVDGMVTIKLVNTTNAVINYQVVGMSQSRTLGEQSEISIKNLKTPITLTYQRPDGGLLLVRAQATATAGMLQISFGATTDLGADTKSLEVQEDGKVFLN